MEAEIMMNGFLDVLVLCVEREYVHADMVAMDAINWSFEVHGERW